MHGKFAFRKFLSLAKNVRHDRLLDSVRLHRKNEISLSRSLRTVAAEFPYRFTSYSELASDAIENPNDFWAEQAKHIDWFKKWDKVLDDSNSPYTQWFPGGEQNTCHNAIDRHVAAGRGRNVALIYDSPVTKTLQKFTYADMLDQVSLCADMLRRHGATRGDTVLIYMPMIPQSIIAMLACARIGAIHSVVFGGFAARELSVRISHCQPRVIVSASAGVEPNRVQNYKPILDEAIELADSKPKSCIIYERPGFGEVTYQKGRDFQWDREMERSRYTACESIPAMDPLYVLYTSGTTGLPKGVVRPSGGYSVVLPWTMQTIYGMSPGETWWAASDLGWVVGHSYICYAPLLFGLQSILFEGKPVGTPDPGEYFRVVSDHNVKAMFIAPTALRAIRHDDYDANYGQKHIQKNWKLQTMFPAGEHLDYETREWAEEKFGVPALDHWWQTESGYPITASCVGVTNPRLDPPRDASGPPVPGWNVQVIKEVSEKLELAKPGDLGHIVIKLPLPPGACSTFWRNDAKFKDTYFTKFPGYYDSMDAGMMTEDGYVCVMSRVDDVINVAGHRISGGALEEAILNCEGVVETAVIGVDDALKGTIPVALCVLRADYIGRDEAVQNRVVEVVRSEIGPVAALKKVMIVPKLPKTRSGKITRSTLAAMANNKPYSVPVTIEDASVFPPIMRVFQSEGLALQCKEVRM